MRSTRFLSIALMMVLLLSAGAFALPNGAQAPISNDPLSGASSGTAIGSSGAIDNAPNYSPNPNSSWTPKLTHDKDLKRTEDNSSWKGGKISVNGRGVGGNLELTVKNIFRKADLEIEVIGNKVGGSLIVNVINNPFLYKLTVKVGGNEVGKDLQVTVSGNAVSDMVVSIGQNEACEGMMLFVVKNIIDYTMFNNIRDNLAKDDMIIDISRNVRPPGWRDLFRKMDVYIIGNNVVQKSLRVYIQYNEMAIEGLPVMHIEIKVNGAGVDMWVRILSNRAYPTGKIEIEIIDNAADVSMEIMVYGNKARKIEVDVKRNYGCVRSNVIVQADAVGPVVKEPLRCLQTMGPDSDGDGLTDLYELMVGTNVSNFDTDGDGIYDGWHDKNGNKKYDGGERYGEIGDPDHPGLKFTGSVDSLVNPTKHKTNPICCDIYVEVDHLKGQKRFPKGSVSLLEKKFEKHRIKLHIDNGWPGKGGGGQSIKHKCDKYNGNEFLHFSIMLGYKNDFYDFKEKPKYFDPLREDIFHYVLIGPYISYEKGGKLITKTSVTGIAEWGGDDFAIAGNALKSWTEKTYAKKDWKSTTPLVFAKTFMHELGHNMKLNDNKVKADESVTVMYEFISAVKPLDYKQPTEWEALEPDEVIEPRD